MLSNIGDPGGDVTDQDWVGLLNEFETEFSNTISDAEGSIFQFDIEAALRIVQATSLDVAVFGNFWYQSINQDVIGVEGWQLLFGAEPFEVDDTLSVSLDTAVGIYEITYKVPSVGILTRFYPSQRTMIEGRAAGALVLFDDFDDHLRRKKTSEADGDGYGFVGSVLGTYEFGSAAGWSPFIGLEADLRYLSADGRQNQHWYGDDPATPDFDDTGQNATGIPYEVESTQYSIGLQVGVRL